MSLKKFNVDAATVIDVHMTKTKCGDLAGPPVTLFVITTVLSVAISNLRCRLDNGLHCDDSV